jgi:hypothetical protein
MNEEFLRETGRFIPINESNRQISYEKGPIVLQPVIVGEDIDLTIANRFRLTGLTI